MKKTWYQQYQMQLSATDNIVLQVILGFITSIYIVGPLIPTMLGIQGESNVNFSFHSSGF